MKEIKYDDYVHKRTGMKTKAVKFKYGMEDGRLKRNNKPYITAHDMGYKSNIPVSERYYIILRKGYKFVLHESFFKVQYKKIRKNK